MHLGFVFKAVYLLPYFSFLRISNLVPHSAANYFTLQHILPGDIFLAPPGLHILIKWSKTLQTKDTVKIIKVPHLPSSLLCPVTVVKNLHSLCPGTPNSPLFQYKQHQPSLRHHLSLLPALRCHHGLQFKCTFTGYKNPWHLNVGLCLEVYHPGCKHISK